MRARSQTNSTRAIFMAGQARRPERLITCRMTSPPRGAPPEAAVRPPRAGGRPDCQPTPRLAPYNLGLTLGQRTPGLTPASPMTLPKKAASEAGGPAYEERDGFERHPLCGT